MEKTERPILFAGRMVRSILARQKTETRRIIKPPPIVAGDFAVDRARMEAIWPSTVADRVPLKRFAHVGDRLWVKEAIRWDDALGRAVFEADDELTVVDTWPWKRPRLPSMFMPRGVSRIALEVTALRVEQLHEIDEAGAIAEGISAQCEDHGCARGCGCALCIEGGCWSARDAYADLWREINGQSSWDSNPWVWVVTFKVTEVRS